MKNYILIMNKENENPEVLGYFRSIKNAKEYIKELGLSKKECGLYRVLPGNFL